MWTPGVGKTPDPYRTSGMGATSIYTPNPEGEMTPKYNNPLAQQSPMYPINQSPGYLPNQMGGGVNGGPARPTGAYGATPLYGYTA